MAQNLYDPNTGRKLNPGESVVDKATGKTVTQGTVFGATTNPTTPSQSTLDSVSAALKGITSKVQTIATKVPAATPQTNIGSSSLNSSQIASINAAREANVNAGTDPYSGGVASWELI